MRLVHSIQAVILAMLLFVWWGVAQANHGTIAVLKDKQAIEEGICYVKGNVMAHGGKELPCVMFIWDKKPDYAWFAVIKNGEVVQVFEAHLPTGKTKLVWGLGQVNI
jgi:hypothetical protein